MNLAISEYKPVPELRPFIESFWMGTFNVAGITDFRQQIVPNGCVELILHLSTDHCFLSKEGRTFSKSPPYTLLGVYSRPYDVRFSSPVEALGVRFFPDGVRNILGVPPGLFLATYEDGTDVTGKIFRELTEKAREISGVSPKLELINDYFLKLLASNKLYRDPTHQTMMLIRKNNGLIDFSRIISEIPLSHRQLQREFKQNYGITIRDYIRLTRLNAINRYMMANPSKLTELAYHLQFTDQSHFIREFKRFTGLSPRKFLEKLPDKFIVNAV